MSQSEITRLRKRIEQEYQASQRVFTDFTPMARHEYLIQRQENIEACFQELQQHVTPEEAVAIIAEAANAPHGASVSSGSTS